MFLPQRDLNRQPSGHWTTRHSRQVSLSWLHLQFIDWRCSDRNGNRHTSSGLRLQWEIKSVLNYVEAILPDWLTQFFPLKLKAKRLCDASEWKPRGRQHSEVRRQTHSWVQFPFFHYYRRTANLQCEWASECPSSVPVNLDGQIFSIWTEEVLQICLKPVFWKGDLKELLTAARFFFHSTHFGKFFLELKCCRHTKAQIFFWIRVYSSAMALKRPTRRIPEQNNLSVDTR